MSVALDLTLSAKYLCVVISWLHYFFRCRWCGQLRTINPDALVFSICVRRGCKIVVLRVIFGGEKPTIRSAARFDYARATARDRIASGSQSAAHFDYGPIHTTRSVANVRAKASHRPSASGRHHQTSGEGRRFTNVASQRSAARAMVPRAFVLGPPVPMLRLHSNPLTRRTDGACGMGSQR